MTPENIDHLITCTFIVVLAWTIYRA